MRRILPVLLCLALGACSDSTGPTDELALQVEASQTVQEGATVESAPGAAVVRGVYVAPTSGYTLRAELQVGSGGEVTVSIAGVRPDAAFAVISALSYRATVALPAGTHTVRVVHEDPSRSDGARRVVTRQRVTVGGS